MSATTTGAIDRLRALAAEQLARDAWSRDRLLAHQRERLSALLAHAVKRSAYYRDALDPAADLAGQPTLSKATLMQEWDRIACDPRLRLADVQGHAAGPHAAEPLHGEFQVFSTSGASGLRGLFAYDARDWAIGLAGTMRSLVRVGARPGERLVGIGAPPGVHMSPRIFATLQAGLGDAPRLSALRPLPEIVATLNDYRPDVVLGYPSVASLLAAEQLAGRLAMAPRMLGLGSEPVTPDVRARVQEAWGIDPVEYYASTELPVLGTSTPEHPRALELLEDLGVFEVVDADDRPVPPGTPGAKILLTNLESRALPLIRYELADSVTESPEPNPAGRPYRHLVRIEGRTADTLTFTARDGSAVPVPVLPLQLGAPFARLPAVRQFQIVHDRSGLTVRVVGGAPDQVRAALAAVIEDAGAVVPPIRVMPVDALEREPGAAAKLKLIVNLR